ncbi:LptA/OstA family protein [Rhodobium gokarnense]|uniref:Lipopolysaccharide export system protein LptA n=1 Tax=Rhodobium gokarnense TaxID=364296 RepID=A0ABT3HGY2_9HYPH|nr:LptA/OstA family protein [Rhodobium gokarnense]MCW2309654.1 lipopolysaccharide export system protein LptA [Rhodobium gokarnense]
MTRFFSTFGTAARLAVVALFAGAVLAAPAARAQTFTESFTGLGVNSNDPIQIEARELEVRDKERVAIFRGDVNVRQQNAVLKAQNLKVFYTGGAGAKGGAQDISKLEAGGKVYVSSGDQVATGDKAVFDLKAEQLTVTGNVVLSKGPNVIQGEILEIDMKTGQAKFRSPSRIRMLIQPKSLGKEKTPPGN